MKRAFVMASAAAYVLAFPSYAQDPHAHDANPPTAAAKKPSEPASDRQFSEHMKQMQAIHERMIAASTPEERQKAMEDARTAMQQSMASMQGMMGKGGMMGSGRAGGSQADRMHGMEQRLDMMQMMMQMMMDQQGMGGTGMGGPGAAK